MINLFPEKQTYPALLSLLLIAKSAAKFISASFKTQNGSDPPSSKTAFLMYFPAICPIALPALEEPVNETP